MPQTVIHRSKTFDASVAALSAFYTARQRNPSVLSGDSDEVDLAEFVKTMRTARRAGRVDPACVDALDALDRWSWGAVADYWEETMAAFEAHVAAHGKMPALANADDDEMRLARWAVKQRQDRAAGVLSEQRQARLEALPRWSWGRRVVPDAA